MILEAEQEKYPVYLGRLKRNYGYTGFNPIKQGTPVFEIEGRAFFEMTFALLPDVEEDGTYLLQKVDCNCNNCNLMERDISKFDQWAAWHRNLEQQEFERAKAKAIADALAVEDEKNREGMLRIAHKMKFQFDKSKLLNYGRCMKFNKPVSFIPNICQVETQECFEHRLDCKT